MRLPGFLSGHAQTFGEEGEFVLGFEDLLLAAHGAGEAQFLEDKPVVERVGNGLQAGTKGAFMLRMRFVSVLLEVEEVQQVLAVQGLALDEFFARFFAKAVGQWFQAHRVVGAGEADGAVIEG